MGRGRRMDGCGLLEAKGVSRTYPARGRKGRTAAVKDVSFLVREGECLGIVGGSGCGKSTLLRMLAGLEKADAGKILYQGEEVQRAVKGKRRSEIQLIYQNSMDAVNMYSDVKGIIGEPLRNFAAYGKPRLAGNGKRERDERMAYIRELLSQVGLEPDCLDKYPRQFSGGQLQRVCIARALAANPRILLLDEPLSSLDVSVQAQIIELFRSLSERRHLTQVLVSHDLEAVYCLSDRVLVMEEGAIVEELTGSDWRAEAKQPYTRKLLAAARDCRGM